MTLDYLHLLPEDFDARSRVWIYQANRLFSLSEALELETILEAFTGEWTSHGHDVKGFATLFFGRFIILIADETQAGVSGCSTDSSVRLIKSIEQQFGISLFDRNLLAFYQDEKVELIPIGQVPYALEHGLLKPDSLYFNNLVPTLQELSTRWIIPIRESWLATRFQMPASAETR